MPHNIPHYICGMKIKFYLSRPTAKSETAIFATISYDGNRVKVYVGENILPKHWNAKTHRARLSLIESPEFNKRLDKLQSAIKKTFLDYQNNNDGATAEPSTLKELLDITLGRTKEVKMSFMQFFNDFIERQKDGLRINKKTGKPITSEAAKYYKASYNNLELFTEKTGYQLDWKTANQKFYIEYTRFLNDSKTSLNTIGSHFKRIKAVLSDAQKQGKEVDIAFKEFTVQKEDADNISLSEDELTALERLDLSDNKRLETVRDLFLIGCHTGMRYSDYTALKPTDIKGDFLHVTQVKTGGKIVIPIHSVVRTIIDKYNGVLPEPISNQKNNDYLKEIGILIESLKAKTFKETTKGGVKVAVAKLRYEMLSTHTARRTFATLQYLKGIPSITIMAITGHKTEKDFLNYIKVTSDEHAHKMKDMWAVDNRQKMKAV